MPKQTEDPAEVALTRTVEIRGKRYTFRELELGEYDKLVKLASHQEADSDGISQEVTDNALLLKMMIRKCCISPKLDESVFSATGYRMYRALARIVNEMHYGEEIVKEITADDGAEETPKGNG
jgi:hypothetical protein